MSWQNYPTSKPRKVSGGIAVRSTRGAIGESWWSRRFIAVLESFALGTRLSRGKTYARQGQVISLDLVPGVVTARVQGSRATPYKVAIAFAPFTDTQWQAITENLAGQALFAAQLLAGQVPSELEQILADLKVPLFPTRFADLRASCSCPDFAVPCKHLAATFFVLAERFDTDPFEVLHWRGRSREELLTRLRSLRTADAPAPHSTSCQETSARSGDSAPDGDQPSLIGGASVGTALAFHGHVGGDHALSVSSFWFAPPAPPLPSPTLADPPTDLVLRQLGPAPAELGGMELSGFLNELYQVMTAGTATANPEDDV
jgi:uncharacterized Zn finger protein